MAVKKTQAAVEAAASTDTASASTAKPDVVIENGGEVAQSFPKAAVGTDAVSSTDAGEVAQTGAAGKPDVVIDNGGEAAASFPNSGAGTVSQPANIPAATEFEPSGAPDQTVGDVDPSHPAVDDNPRANTTVDQNRIDFNDPTKSGQEIVSEQLGMTKPSDAA